MSAMRLNATVFAMLVIASVPTTAGSEENKSFKVAVSGIQPVLWRDYQSLQQNDLACSREHRRETATCQEVEEHIVRALVDALLQAATENIGNPPKDKFCDKTTTTFALENNTGGMAAYAMLLIDERLKFGSGLYKNLPDTYLGKIVFDALRAQSPCPL